MDINIKRIYDNAKIPTQGSEYAAGYDLYACIDREVGIPPHTAQKISTGLAMEIPNGYFGAIFARSGLASKENLRPSNAVGILDSDYRGEIFVSLHNDSNFTRTITPNERIAQLVLLPCQKISFIQVKELDKTVRGGDGFGSTGK